MKKIVASIMMLAVVISALCISVSAVSKSDLLAEAAKSPVYKYIKVSVENAARNVEVTDEQAEKLLPIVKKGVALLTSDNGNGVVAASGKRNYTEADVKAVFECIDEACAVMDFHYTCTPTAKPVHAGDMIFKVYDKNNTLIFEYDGDAVADTDIEESTGSATLLISGVALAAAGLAAAVYARKRYTSKTAA